MEHEDAKKDKLKTRALAVLTESESKEWQKEVEELKLIKSKILQNDTAKFKLVENIIVTKEGKTWIPEEKRNEFIIAMHKRLCHAGVKKVLNYIEIAYDMKELHKSVKEIIGRCEECQKRKTMTVKTKETIIKLTANRQFEDIHMDFCGPLKTSLYGKRYILAIIDQYSRYISLTAVKSQDEKTTREVLMNKWILKFGAPRRIFVDCGKVFESKMMKEIAEKHNIQIQYSSPYHHSGNGLIERQFRTIRDYINISLKEKTHKDWTEVLPEVEFTLNATIQKTIGMSPAEVIFGCKIYHRWNGITKSDENKEELRMRIENNERKVKYKEDGRTNRIFKINDEVLVKAEGQLKEEDRYVGPFKILRQIHERSFELINHDGKRIIRNVEWLKPFRR
jgi:transposase InsO family protein